MERFCDSAVASPTKTDIATDLPRAAIPPKPEVHNDLVSKKKHYFVASSSPNLTTCPKTAFSYGRICSYYAAG